MKRVNYEKDEALVRPELSSRMTLVETVGAWKPRVRTSFSPTTARHPS